MHHHNTTNETGNDLKEFESKAKSQEEKVMNIFRIMSGFKKNPTATPSVLQKTYFPNTPITSIRRALTNLTKYKCLQCSHLYNLVNDGDFSCPKCNNDSEIQVPQLIKLEEKTEGMYGRPEHYWQLKP